jgi:iron complex outermembrane recepter protein
MAGWQTRVDTGRKRKSRQVDGARPGAAFGATPALFLCLAAGIAAADPGAGAEPDAVAIPSADLGRVVVKGQTLQGANAPFSVTRFDPDRIRDARISHPQELFRFVPGMTVRSFGLGGVADSIVLRGFGGGGHGGDIGFVVDGIPLNEAMSHADGYADLAVLVPLEIGAMTVYRGPVSAIYGNFNRGGLVAVETRKGGEYRNADLSIGSDTTIDAQMAIGTTLVEGNQALNIAGQVYHTDGFRPQSDSTRGTLAGRWAVELSPSVTLAISARGHTGEADSAAYLTVDQFNRDPEGIDPRVQNDGAEKDFVTLRADLGWTVSPRLTALGFAYTTQQDFTRWFTRPVGPANWAQREEAYEREVYGAGFNLNGRIPGDAGALNWVAGIEAFRESTDYLFFDNLDFRRRAEPAIFDRAADLNSVALFGELEAPLHDLFKPWVGVRHDRFTGDCKPNGPETGNQPCGRLNSTNNTSPKLGVRSDVAPGLQLRASFAEGFALPSNFVKYSSGAADLDPNVFEQTEFGVLLNRGNITADVAWYHLRSSDEFRTIAPGVFENFGSTVREGLEASITWFALTDLAITAVYGSADSEIRRNANPALEDNQVTGVPDYSATLSIAYEPMSGWGAGGVLRRVDDYAIDAANTLFDGSYTTVDLAVTYTRTGRFGYRAYIGVDNATDEEYFTSSFISAGTQLVAPAAPRTFRAGIQLDF